MYYIKLIDKYIFCHTCNKRLNFDVGGMKITFSTWLVENLLSKSDNSINIYYELINKFCLIYQILAGRWVTLVLFYEEFWKI